MNSEIERIFQAAQNSFVELEPWKYYYRQRKKEFEIIANFSDFKQFDKVLDVGCGCGFSSALLSSYAKEVIAVDMPQADPLTHSIGLDKTQRLLDGLRIRNVKLLGAQAEYLPLKSGSVSMVFNSCLIEHIPLHIRKQAVAELARVLTKGGIIVSVLPNFIVSLYNIPYYYLDLFCRVLYMPLVLGIERVKSIFNKGTTPYLQKKLKSFVHAKRFNRLLIPPVHGAYSSHGEEIANSIPCKWVRMFEDNNFKVIKSFTIRFIPYENLVSIYLFEKSRYLSGILGDLTPFKYLGVHFCILAERL